MKIIMISGKSQSGKDTVAEILKTKLQADGQRVLTIHFADLVKTYALLYFNWDGEKNEQGRDLLQTIGTTIMRNQYPTYWAEIVAKFLNGVGNFNYFDVILIPDWRFINEYATVYDYVQSCGHEVISIRVNRYQNQELFTNPKMNKQQLNHISECELDNFNFEWIIYNSGTLEDLDDSIAVFFEELLYYELL